MGLEGLLRHDAMYEELMNAESARTRVELKKRQYLHEKALPPQRRQPCPATIPVSVRLEALPFIS